jgi:plastocyanin
MKKNSGILNIAVCMFIAVVIFSITQAAFAASPEANPSGGQTKSVEMKSVEIKIDNFTFTPMEVTVKVGTQITWTNGDDIPHTVVSSDNAFKSKTLDTDEKFSFTPTKPGTYSYFCSIHPKMTAKVVVQ